MLEASIRKVTVTVSWKEGKQDRQLEVVQYVTNPTQGQMDEEAADLSEAMGGAMKSGSQDDKSGGSK